MQVADLIDASQYIGINVPGTDVTQLAVLRTSHQFIDEIAGLDERCGVHAE